MLKILLGISSYLFAVSRLLAECTVAFAINLLVYTFRGNTFRPEILIKEKKRETMEKFTDLFSLVKNENL